ncbi:hypothetical protein [Terrisporobacter sp.]
MVNLIDEINTDLIRCKNVIEENNYLEVVIAIEEFQDKYKNKIKSLSENSSDVVWSYTVKNLEIIKSCLIEYRDDLILKEKIKSFHEKLLDFKSYIENNEIENKSILDEIINSIEEVNYSDINLDEKYKKIKPYIDLVNKFDRKTALYILELITLVIT